MHRLLGRHGRQLLVKQQSTQQESKWSVGAQSHHPSCNQRLVSPAGTTLQLPEGYTGQVLMKQQGAQEESIWVSQAAFKEFTSWKHGIDPLRTDSAQRRLDYLKICQQVSNCLHESWSAERSMMISKTTSGDPGIPHALHVMEACHEPRAD